MTPRNARRLAARRRAAQHPHAAELARAERLIEACGARNVAVPPDHVIILAEPGTLPGLIVHRDDAAEHFHDCPRALANLRELRVGTLIFVLLEPVGVVTAMVLPPAAGAA